MSRRESIIVGTAVAAFLCLSSAAPALQTKPVAAADGATTLQPAEVDDDVGRLREALEQEVPGLITDTPEQERSWNTRARAAVVAAGYTIERPQLLVVVDRNPHAQQMRIILARPDGSWQSLGGTKVSTGRPRGFEHFLTPTGVFLHSDAIVDWRAEGTFNKHHIRGLGLAGMRVWDFGWQRALKGWGPSGKFGKMRLLMHATDPATLERRIGHRASDGCVRLPTEMDRFLDRHGVLDYDYERVAKTNPRFAELLLPDRLTTPLAGDALVVIDSAE